MRPLLEMRMLRVWSQREASAMSVRAMLRVGALNPLALVFG
jgi:hypothetical protein